MKKQSKILLAVLAVLILGVIIFVSTNSTLFQGRLGGFDNFKKEPQDNCAQLFQLCEKTGKKNTCAQYKLQCLKKNILNKNIYPTPTLLPKVLNYCYLDHSLKVGSFHGERYQGGDSSIESVLTENITSCRGLALSRDYRFSKYFYTTPDFAIICTEPCSIDDTSFFEASLEGHQLGVNALREKVGYLPKRKMEFHLGKDGDCFVSGYGDYPTGYASSIEKHAMLCNSDYYWYVESQGTDWERDLNYVRSLESQTLTIHEPIHRIFIDYSPEGILPPPEYKIQESFSKGLSLNATGIFPGYNHEFYTGYGQYSLENSPPEGSPLIYNFLIYSLSQRFGFNESRNTLDFFRLYKERESLLVNSNLKVKQILDEILGINTIASFNDVGINFD